MEQHVIKINGVIWTIHNTKTWNITRGPLTARLTWDSSTSGKIIQRNIQNGRFMSNNFTTT